MKFKAKLLSSDLSKEIPTEFEADVEGFGTPFELFINGRKHFFDVRKTLFDRFDIKIEGTLCSEDLSVFGCCTIQLGY